jgi:mono/diheme cytochrome c family protein
MRSTLIAGAVLAAFAFSGASQAADPKLVTYFKETCGVCHGEGGEGTPGLAPPFKGNKFISEGSEADIATVITKGREGAAKRYKDLPSPMPPQSMSDSRLKALVAYLKTDLQK